ncbi:MAG: NAD(+) synthase [Brevinema sp.]
MKVSIAQINPHLGNFALNTEKIRDAIRKAIMDNSHILLLPYGAISGFPQGQLMVSQSFHEQITTHLEELALETLDSKLSVFAEGHKILSKGKIDYDQINTFPQEQPYMLPDIFNKNNLDIFVNLGPKVFEKNRPEAHELDLKIIAQEKKAWVFDINLAGATDELVFNGLSSITDPNGNIVTRLKFLEEDFITIDLDNLETFYPIAEIPAGEEVLKQVIVSGIKNYFIKNNFSNILVSLSGGIDSALVLALAVEAVGSKKVSAVYLPSKFSADMSCEESKKLCENLDIPFKIISIETLHQSFEQELSFLEQGVWNENIQARIRGSIIMSIANDKGSLVLSTGNKSELAMGYCTLYGDMCGGLSPISDLLKTEVRALSSYINYSARKEIIPIKIITRAPSAELREDQIDETTLPNYEFLDQVLFLHCEEGFDAEQIITQLDRADDVMFIFSRLYANSYKRKQAPVGIKVSKRFFGLDWHIPSTVFPWFKK